MSGNDSRRGGGFTNDQMAGFVIVLAFGALLWARHRSIFGAIGRWLQDHQITTPPGHGLIDVPHLGGFDAARLAVAIAAVILMMAALSGVVRMITRTNRPAHGSKHRDRTGPIRESDTTEQ